MKDIVPKLFALLLLPIATLQAGEIAVSSLDLSLAASGSAARRRVLLRVRTVDELS